MYELTCVNCKNTFAAKRWNAQYCSNKCNVAQWRIQHKAHVSRAEELLRQFTETVASGSDPAVLQSLSREARILFAKSIKA
jgi:hypothetical protein